MSIAIIAVFALIDNPTEITEQESLYKIRISFDKRESDSSE